MGKKSNELQSLSTRDHILEVARELMVEKGVKETSLKDIAKAAKISAGTLYYHYSAKEDIIYDIAKVNMQQITDGFLELVEKARDDNNPETILKKVFEQVLEAETRGKLHLYLISNAGTSEGLISRKFQEQYAQWRQTFEFGLNKIRPNSNNAVLSYMLIAMLDGLIIQKMFGAANIPTEEMIQVVLGK